MVQCGWSVGCMKKVQKLRLGAISYTSTIQVSIFSGVLWFALALAHPLLVS